MPHRAGAQRLRDIAEALERIRAYCDGLSFEQFKADSRSVPPLAPMIQAVIDESAP